MPKPLELFREDRPLTQVEFIDFWVRLSERLLDHSMNTQAIVAGSCIADALRTTFGEDK